MTTYTDITKATDPGYTNVNPVSQTQYNDPNILYSDTNIFYDGGNPALWSDVAKATGGTTFTISAGRATGLIMPPTYARTQTYISDQWSRITKAT